MNYRSMNAFRHNNGNECCEHGTSATLQHKPTCHLWSHHTSSPPDYVKKSRSNTPAVLYNVPKELERKIHRPWKKQAGLLPSIPGGGQPTQRKKRGNKNICQVVFEFRKRPCNVSLKPGCTLQYRIPSIILKVSHLFAQTEIKTQGKPEGAGSAHALMSDGAANTRSNRQLVTVTLNF